jgi:hypothetical protein
MTKASDQFSDGPRDEGIVVVSLKTFGIAQCPVRSLLSLRYVPTVCYVLATVQATVQLLRAGMVKLLAGTARHGRPAEPSGAWWRRGDDAERTSALGDSRFRRGTSHPLPEHT